MEKSSKFEEAGDRMPPAPTPHSTTPKAPRRRGLRLGIAALALWVLYMLMPAIKQLPGHVCRMSKPHQLTPDRQLAAGAKAASKVPLEIHIM
jgi:hypothetical protein